LRQFRKRWQAVAGSSDSVNHTALRLKKIIDLQSMLISRQFNLPDFMQAVVIQVQALTGAGGAAVELLDGDELIYAAASGSIAPHVGLRLHVAGSLSGASIRNNEVLVSTDTATDPRVDLAACRKVGAGSMIVVPLRRLDTATGVLKVTWLESRAFEEHDIDMLRMTAGLLGSALGQQLEIERRRQLEEELSNMARHDPLTGLPNRRLFKDRLEQALARHARSSSGELSLMYFDIDHFKNVNDTLGHAAGDTLLKGFVLRIKALVRSVDTFARLGGDEFALLIESVPNTAAAEAVAEKILEVTQTHFELEGHIVRVSTSIGVVTVSHNSNITADGLIRNADGAMHEAKRAGRNAFRTVRKDLSATS
jgi:diguanylate cyclase (GGDEF)-like protein